MPVLAVRDRAKSGRLICGIVLVAQERLPGPTRCAGWPRPPPGISVARLIGFVPKLIRIDETDSAGEPTHWAH